MANILIFGDVGIPSGFGRIVNETGTRLLQRGHKVIGASLYWDGCHPNGLPFFVAPLAGKDIWMYVTSLIIEHRPDVVISCQDFPYHHTLYNGCRLDFSKFKWVAITPIDGTPVHRDWVNLIDHVDAMMVISKFGVEGLRKQGKVAHLLQPGVNTKEFFPKDRAELRKQAGLEDEFLLGTMCMNQGRKAIPHMLQGFFEFAKEKPNVRYLLDMDKVGAGGWDIPALVEAMGESLDKIIFREDLAKKGLTELNDRYNLLDAHVVLSHREGYGLPLHEAMACQVPSMAMDWCSGTEICGEGKGILIKRRKHPRYSTWGNAFDYDPDVDDFVKKLNFLYNHPAERKALGVRGYEWAIQQNWETATNQLEAAIQSAQARPARIKPMNQVLIPTPLPTTPPPAGELPPTPIPSSEQASWINRSPQEGIGVSEMK